MFTLLCSIAAHSQIVISNSTATPFTDNILRYHFTFETNENCMAYVEWQRNLSEDLFGGGGFPVEHSNVAMSAMNFDISVIGFVNNSSYQYRIVAWNAGSCVATDWTNFETGSLPSDVTGLTNLYTNTPGLDGYYMTNNVSTPDKTIQIFNRDGEVVWYDWHAGVDGFGGVANCQFWNVAPNGNILVTECHRVQERDLHGNIIHEIDFTGTEYENLFFHHDIQINSNGNYIVIAAELRNFDFTSLGGAAVQPVIGEGILEFDTSGNVVWQWSTFDYWDPVAEGATNLNAFFTPIFGANAINWQHCNSLNQDYDGHYLLSFKELDRLVKVDRNTGDIIFTLSGMNATIDIQNDSGFADQHDFTDVEPNKYIVFDNTGDAPSSRMVEFAIDYYKVPIAYVTWSYNFPDSLFSPIVGSARRLPNGNRYGVCGAPFANFNNRGHIIEVNPEGEIVWHARQSSWIYRSYFYEQLWQEDVIDIEITQLSYTCASDVLELDAQPIGGYWYGDGVNVDEFTTDEAGEYWVYYKYGWEVDSMLITVGALPEVIANTVPVQCFGENNGSVEIFVNGNSMVQEENLVPDTYNYTFSDKGSCSASISYTITEPEVLTCELTVSNEIEGEDGSACVEISGGTAGYSILWSDSGIEECIDNLGAGDYSVSVTDENGCTCEQDFTVFVGIIETLSGNGFALYPNPAVDQITLVEILDNDLILSIEIFDASGRMVLRFEKNNPRTFNISQLAPGHYNVRIVSERSKTILPFVKKD